MYCPMNSSQGIDEPTKCGHLFRIRIDPKATPTPVTVLTSLKEKGGRGRDQEAITYNGREGEGSGGNYLRSCS